MSLVAVVGYYREMGIEIIIESRTTPAESSIYGHGKPCFLPRNEIIKPRKEECRHDVTP
jgi:hypothetical protein